MLQMPAFPVAPVTTDGAAQVRSAAASQQVPTSGIPVATTEFVKPSPSSQQAAAEQHHSGLDPKERVVVGRTGTGQQQEQQTSQEGNQQSQPRAPRYGFHQDAPDNLSELSVGAPPTYRFHRTPDGNLYALSGRQAGELAPVPGNSFATMYKMRLVGSKAASAPLQTSRMMSQLASFQGKAAATVALQNQQRAAVAKHQEKGELFVKVVHESQGKAKEVSLKSAENTRQVEKRYADVAPERKTEAKRAEFKQKLKTAKVATVDDKIRVRAKLPKVRSVASTGRKVAAFKKAMATEAPKMRTQAVNTDVNVKPAKAAA
jgi:hypothetical protein